MRIPTITGLIRRRILLNYRVDPSVVSAILPTRFHPKLVDGFAIAGICLIRLEKIRPKGLPEFLGFSSENSAHRIAVEWDAAGEPMEGVFVPRRDTDSPLNSLAGGRIFPGVHHRARFEVSEKGGCLSMRVTPKTAESPLIAFEARESAKLPQSSVFDTLAESSAFFEPGSVGYSSRPDSGRLEGLHLKTFDWKVSPLDILEVRSAFYDDLSAFPEGSIEFDHALLMRDIEHEWQAKPSIPAGETGAPLNLVGSA